MIKLRKSRFILLLVIMLLMLSGCSPEKTVERVTDLSQRMEDAEVVSDEISKLVSSLENEIEEIEKETSDELKSEAKGTIEVHYIDVGQGDSVLIKQGESAMLIDAGDNHYGATVVDYLRMNEVTNLDYVIGSHPHSDHVGGPG